MWVFSHWIHPAQPLLWGVAICSSLIAAALDVYSRRIPNYLTGAVLLGGLVWSWAAVGWGGLADAAAGCLLLMFLFVVLFIFAGGGAGDAKMMGAIGAWLGVVNGLFALGGVLLAGGLLAVGVSIARRRLGRVLKNIRSIVTGLLWVVIGRGRLVKAEDVRPTDSQVAAKMPYGVAIIVGIVMAAVGVAVWRRML